MGKIGELGDVVIAKNSRAKFEVPRWLKEYEFKGFHVWCEQLNRLGKPSGACTGMEVFIDQDQVMWVEPDRGVVGKFIITLEATNKYGDQDSTTFTVEVVEIDHEDCDEKTQQCECLAQTAVFMEGRRKPRQCYVKKQMHLVHDQFFRFWLEDTNGNLIKTAWIGKFE